MTTRRFPPPWNVIEHSESFGMRPPGRSAGPGRSSAHGGAACATPPHRKRSTTRLCLALVQAPLQSDLVIDEPTTQPNFVEVKSLYRIVRTRRFTATAIAAKMAEMVKPAPAHKAIETAALMVGLFRHHGDTPHRRLHRAPHCHPDHEATFGPRLGSRGQARPLSADRPRAELSQVALLPSQLISIPKMFQANIAAEILIASTRSACARERMSTPIASANFILRRLRRLSLKVPNRGASSTSRMGAPDNQRCRNARQISSNERLPRYRCGRK
jgi:hypothetical protein